MKASQCMVILSALAVLAIGCQQSSDAKLSKKFVGTWVLDRVNPDGIKIHSTLTFVSPGRYSCQANTYTNSHLAFTVNSEGTYQIKDGYLIDTVTKHSEQSFAVPSTFRARLIRFDGRELVAHDEINSVEVVFRKERK